MTLVNICSAFIMSFVCYEQDSFIFPRSIFHAHTLAARPQKIKAFPPFFRGIHQHTKLTCCIYSHFLMSNVGRLRRAVEGGHGKASAVEEDCVTEQKLKLCFSPPRARPGCCLIQRDGDETDRQF